MVSAKVTALAFAAAFVATAVAAAAPLRTDFFRSGGKVHKLYMDPRDGADDERTRELPVRLANGTLAFVLPRILVGAAPEALAGHLATGWRIQTAAFADDVAVVTVDHPQTALTAAENFVHLPGVRWAHPDFRFSASPRGSAFGAARVEPFALPEDEPLASLQWHLTNADLRGAWNVSIGTASTTVAILDFGFEATHPDLADAWLVNTGEIPGNRLDDDGNGLIDDVAGWNFAINGPNLIYGMANSHGTAAAGVIGARANGQGVTGLCPGCRVLPIVIDNVVSNAAAAFRYAAARGAAVISNSWGYAVGTPATDAVVEAIARAATDGRRGLGTTIVFAMSNVQRDDCRGPEPDISSLDTVVAVSSVDQQDAKVPASGYGPCLELVAPSSVSAVGGIVTTDRQGANGYNRGGNPSDLMDLDYTNGFYGTSAATPQVAAAFGLLYSAEPGLRRDAALKRMLDAADKVSAADAAYDPATGHSLRYGFGRLNVGRALLDAR